MLVLLAFAFVAGLFTILAPCIWPLLPIVLSSSTTGGHRKPLGITLGIITSFSIFTLSVSYLVMLFHFDPNVLRVIAAFAIAFLGLTMLIPSLLLNYELVITKLSSFIGGKSVATHHGFFGGFITGLSLGIIWSPCAGPILATIATLAATQAVSFQVVLITIAFSIGVGIPLFLFSLLGRWLFLKSKFVSAYTGHLQKIFGIIMMLTALAIYTNYDKVIQAKLLNVFPQYTSFLTELETRQEVKEQLDILKGTKSDLPTVKAPEFVGISHWLNLPSNQTSLSIEQLRGKVVLVDFWTYTCINCIRTLPYVTSWYEKYKDKGFVVIGVHTPEFEFEKKTANVEAAIKQYHITYPVAQDNEYLTWNAYNNQYWPAEYLIDAKGNIRHTHFGEGEYDKTEMAIKELLEEKGASADASLVPISDQTPKDRSLTPETYLGKARMERFVANTTQLLPLHYFTYKGTWDIQNEQAIAKKGSVLELHFYADKVFLVVTPKTTSDKATIFLDGKEVSKIIFDVPKLYEIINFKGNNGDHILRIEFKTDGTAVYAFTFG